MKAYRTQKIMHQKGPLLLYDLPFRSNALIEIIVLNNEDKNYNKCYPVAKLFEIGRLKFKCSIEEWMSNSLKYSGLHPLELTPQISIESCNLPCNYHKDSADQIIVAIARTILYLDPCIKDILSFNLGFSWHEICLFTQIAIFIKKFLANQEGIFYAMKNQS